MEGCKDFIFSGNRRPIHKKIICVMNTNPYSKMRTVILFVTIHILASLRANGQGVFQNLDFEQANPVVVVGSPFYPYEVTAASALPYWTVTYGNVPQTQILYNNIAAGSTFVDLLGTTDAHGPSALDGNYSVFLQGGGTASDSSISQTGIIPSGMQSLLFEAQPGRGSFELSVGTQSIPFMALATEANYTLYGANILEWAGQTEQITFSALEDFSDANNWEIDDISFSPNAVPEPGTLVLMLVAGAGFGLRRWRAGGS